jgi:hypothetical protein
LLTAGAVTVVGAVGFIGLIGPHMARRLVGGDVRRLFPFSVVLTAILLLGADIAARTLTSWPGVRAFPHRAQSCVVGSGDIDHPVVAHKDGLGRCDAQPVRGALEDLRIWFAHPFGRRHQVGREIAFDPERRDGLCLERMAAVSDDPQAQAAGAQPVQRFQSEATVEPTALEWQPSTSGNCAAVRRRRSSTIHACRCANVDVSAFQFRHCRWWCL